MCSEGGQTIETAWDARCRRHFDAVGLALERVVCADDLNAFLIRIATTGRSPAVVLNVPTSADPTGRHGSTAFADRLEHALRLLLPYVATHIDRKQGAVRLVFDIGDHGSPWGLSFDRPSGTAWPLVPDLYLLAADRPPPADYDAFRDEFHCRLPLLFWRGSSTGRRIDTVADLLAVPRVAACRTLNATLKGRVDCKISRIVQLSDLSSELAEATLQAEGLLGDAVAEDRFADYQMYLDLPGNTAAWGTCLKYLCGCLILRVGVRRELFYSHRLEPWVHYVPVSDDVSDVADRLQWIGDHPPAAARIAHQGQQKMGEIIDDLEVSMLEILSRHDQGR